MWLAGEEWRMVGIYVNNDLERKLEELKKWRKKEKKKE